MIKKPSFNNQCAFRKKVAHEAAFLLYTSQEKEYKQAKKMAARNLGVRVLPKNIEIAEELDCIAKEREADSRADRLIRMRKEAFEIMSTLRCFSPKLIGSVWRGTVNLNSDIDIMVYSSGFNEVLCKIQEKGYNVVKTEHVLGPKQKKASDTFHITVSLSSGDEVEITVRDPEEKIKKTKCEIYGDLIKGLDIDQLSKVLAEDPLKRFVP